MHDDSHAQLAEIDLYELRRDAPTAEGLTVFHATECERAQGEFRGMVA